jgi:DNA-binding transcriptional regulator YiaG
MPRKSFPTSVKTLGDQIRLKRHEIGLTASKIAKSVGIPVTVFNKWELDQRIPSQAEWAHIAGLLDNNPLPYPVNPTAE